jgi:hypothetical protein
MLRLFLFQYLYCLYYWDNPSEAEEFSKGPRKTIALEKVKHLRRLLIPSQGKAVRGQLAELNKEVKSGFYQYALVTCRGLEDALKPTANHIRNALNDIKSELKRGHAPHTRHLLDRVKKGGFLTTQERILVNKVLNRLHEFPHSGMGQIQATIDWPHNILWPQYEPQGFEFCAGVSLEYGLRFLKFLSEKYPKVIKNQQWQANYANLLSRYGTHFLTAQIALV